VFAANGVLDQAGWEGPLERAQLAVVEAWRDHLNLKIPDLQGAGGRLGFDANQQAFAGEAMQAQVLSDVLADAAAEGRQQELGRGHALVGGSIFGRLIEQDPMVTRLRREKSAAAVT
jgi:hypothetical protein